MTNNPSSRATGASTGTGTASTSLPDPVDSRKGGLALLMTVLITAAIAFQLNASMLSPVLATMARELNTDEAAVGLTQTAFFTGGAMCGLFLPRLSDIVGRRKILLIMLAVMALGGVIAALAPNIEVLMLARAMQGIAGPTIPMTLIILRSQPEPALAADPYAATWEDPAPPGVKAVYKGSFWSGYASFEINILSMVRGNAALKAAQKMSNYNITPPRNQEWYIVTLWVKALEAPGDRAEIKSEDFHFISRSGTEYRHHFLINDIQGLRTLYTGSEQTAHIACLIDKGDEPLIVYQPNSLNPLWFDPGRQAEEAPAT